jgi:hypothetical protein
LGFVDRDLIVYGRPNAAIPLNGLVDFNALFAHSTVSALGTIRVLSICNLFTQARRLGGSIFRKVVPHGAFGHPDHLCDGAVRRIRLHLPDAIGNYDICPS